MMPRNYAALPHEYLQEMEELNDAEFGRLARALLVYSSTGEKVALSGNERFVFKRVMMQEDRFQASYDEASSMKSEAARKAARARWDKGRTSSAMRTDAGGCERIQTNTNAYKRTPCDADASSAMRTDAGDAYTNTNTETNTNCSSTTTAMRQNFGNWSSTQANRELAEARSFYMDRINPMPGTVTLAELDGFTQELGSKLVIRAIEIAMGERKTAWSYIRGILRNWQRDGITCIEDLQRRESEKTPMEGKTASRRPEGRPEARSAERDELMRIARGK